MLKYIYTMIMLLITTLPMAYAGDHRSGDKMECFYDSNPGDGKWKYYYCGGNQKGCKGRGGNGGQDKHRTLYHGQSFRFESDPKDTYWCCGGTKEEKGRFVLSSDWIVSRKTVKQELPDSNGKCNASIETDACGNEHTLPCDTPDMCNAGFILRKGTCTPICNGGQVFESETSNTCITCETTAYQGIDKKGKYCIKCFKDAEFFDRKEHECIEKKTMLKYSKDPFRKCWQCPNSEVNKTCIQYYGGTMQQTSSDIENMKKICKIPD